MTSYFVDGASGGVEGVLIRLLPRRRDPWVLFGPDDSVIAVFTTSVLPIMTTTYGRDPYLSYSFEYDASVMADINGDGRDDKLMVLRILREIRGQCGGVIRDEDGRVFD